MRLFGLYLLIINAIAFIIYGVDKSKAKNNKWRIPEATLIGLAAFGGGAGALLGMLVWHHKTKKWKFRILVPLFLILWCVGAFLLVSKIPVLMPGPFISGEAGAAADDKGQIEAEITENPADEVADVPRPETAVAEEPQDTPIPEPPQPEPFDITLAFAGDINFDDTWSVMSYYHSKGDDLEAVIDPEYLKEMRAADIMWINNEFTYSDGGSPLDGKAYTFRSKPENVGMLEEMGVDIVGLANNHVYDYGKQAFLDTMDTLDNAGILYVGAGHDLSEAKAPVYIETDGVKIAYVAASRAEKYKMTPQATDTEPGILRCYDNELFLESIKEADENADYVIALPHWGTEYSTVLEPAQTDGAVQYIEAGADAVIGAHTHCLQEISEYDGKPIVYSLGNFWFNEKTLDTMLYEIHLSGTKTAQSDGQVEVDISDVTTEELYGVQSGCVTTMNK